MRLFGISMVVISAVFVVAQGADTDPVSELLTEYRKFSTVGLTDADRIAKYEEWRRMLLTIAEDNPTSKSKMDALREAMRICNALGDSDQSLKLIEELLDEKSLSLWDQYDLQDEHAGVSRMKCLLNPSEEACLESVESYKRTNAIIDRLLKDPSSMPTFIQLTTEGKQITTSSIDRLTEEKINNFEQMGSMLIKFKDSVVLSRLAKDYYKQARKSLQDWGPPRVVLPKRNIGFEYFVPNEALAAAYAGDMQDMEEALHFLNTLDNKRWPTSFYVEDIVRKAFLAKGKDPRDFLIKWVEQNKDDERTCNLVCMIAVSFMREKPEGYIDLVFPYVESLVDGKYAVPLMQLEAEGIARGNSGNYAMILWYMVKIYTAKEDYAKAIQYNNRLLEMFPNYGGLTASAKMHASVLANKKEYQEYAKSLDEPKSSLLFVRLFFVLAGICLCTYALFRMWRERKDN